jgi:hypothetical protein
VIGARTFPLSAGNVGVTGPLDFADCVVAADPFTADFFFRTETGSAEEQRALEVLGPLMSPCLPKGQQVQFQIPLMRACIGEALWHAANNSAPAPAGAVAGQEAAQ